MVAFSGPVNNPTPLSLLSPTESARRDAGGAAERERCRGRRRSGVAKRSSRNSSQDPRIAFETLKSDPPNVSSRRKARIDELAPAGGNCSLCAARDPLGGSPLHPPPELREARTALHIALCGECHLEVTFFLRDCRYRTRTPLSSAIPRMSDDTRRSVVREERSPAGIVWDVGLRTS